MASWVELARHPFTAWLGTSQGDARSTGPDEPPDPYATARSQRLQQLEAAGKCLARSGKHANLRYWPSECGSRVLLEHRRRRQGGARPATRLSSSQAG